MKVSEKAAWVMYILLCLFVAMLVTSCAEFREEYGHGSYSVSYGKATITYTAPDRGHPVITKTPPDATAKSKRP